MKVGQLAWFNPPITSQLGANRGRLVKLEQCLGSPAWVPWGSRGIFNHSGRMLWRVTVQGSPLDTRKVRWKDPTWIEGIDLRTFPCPVAHLIPLPDFPEESESPSAERPINATQGV